MNININKTSTLFVAAALIVPAGAGAATDANVQLQVRAAADAASAQRLAQVSPERADAFLKRSRSELQAAFAKAKKAAADDQAQARRFQQHLRSDAKTMRSLAAKSSGRLARHAKQAMRVDRLMVGQLAAAQAPADEQSSATSDNSGANTIDVSASVRLS